jgi:uncharacterized membrane protein YcgQ (UPF0703/DUF1980 family)
MRFKPCTVLAIMFCLSCTDASAESYNYNTMVTLEGALVLPTTDPEVTYCDIQHKFPAINLLKPISVVCEPTDTFCQTETDVILLHLVLKQPQMAKFNKLKGKTVKVRGILFHAESGHDFTSILMDVDLINP